jgi:hypothetical protein
VRSTRIRVPRRRYDERIEFLKYVALLEQAEMVREKIIRERRRE